MSAIDKYNKRAKKINSLLCVGLDPDFEKIPEKFKATPFPQFEFNKYIINETHEYAAAYKHNIAFYEAKGAKGISELQMTTDYIQKNHPDIFIMLDAKRADVGNTNTGYVTEAFDLLKVDGITINPYLGQEAVQPFLNRIDKISSVLALNSNPGAGEFQNLDVGGGKKLWQQVVENVSTKWNTNNNCMIVMGATHPEEMKEARSMTGATFLVPGIGSQGGDLEMVMTNGLDSDGLGLMINSSRGIIFSEDPKKEAQKLCEEIRKYKDNPDSA